MSERGRQGGLLRGLGEIWLSWLITAIILLFLFSFIISKTAFSQHAMGYAASALSFGAACAAGAKASKGQTAAPLVSGLLCAAGLLIPLLLCGLLIDYTKLSSDSVLSLVSLSFAGAVFGSVFFGGHLRRKSSKRSSFSRKKNDR